MTTLNAFPVVLINISSSIYLLLIMHAHERLPNVVSSLRLKVFMSSS
jgi:hypothetical protein